MVFQLKKSREDLDLLVSIEKRDPEATISSLYVKISQFTKCNALIVPGAYRVEVHILTLTLIIARWIGLVAAVRRVGPVGSGGGRHRVVVVPMDDEGGARDEGDKEIDEDGQERR